MKDRTARIIACAALGVSIIAIAGIFDLARLHSRSYQCKLVVSVMAPGGLTTGVCAP